MASQIVSARDISIDEQHEFITLAKEFEWAAVKRRINACPALVNVRPAMRWSALHQAAFSGSADAVRFLLNNDAAIDAKSTEGETPLDIAKTDEVRSILTAFASSGKVPTPLRMSGSVTKAAKVMKAMKSMKVMKKTKIAKGKRGKALVYKGKFQKTSGGLTKDLLTKNKDGKIVSKRMQAHGKKSYVNITSWVQAFVKARAQMGLSGFVALKKGSDLYLKTMEFYLSRE